MADTPYFPAGVYNLDVTYLADKIARTWNIPTSWPSHLTPASQRHGSGTRAS